MIKHSKNFIDYYQLLGVSNTADIATIKRAYRSQIARHHPDKLHDCSDDMASLLNSAYATLKDIEMRKRYDERWLQYHRQAWLLDKRQQAVQALGLFAQRQAHQWRQRVKSQIPSSVQDNIATEAGRLAARAFEHAKRLWQQLNSSGLPICHISLDLAYHGGQVTFTMNDQAWQAVLPKGLTTGDKISLSHGSDTLTVQIAIDEPNVSVNGKDVYYQAVLQKSDSHAGVQVTLPPPLSLKLGVPAQVHYPTSVRLSGRGLPSIDGSGDLVVIFEVQD